MTKHLEKGVNNVRSPTEVQITVKQKIVERHAVSQYTISKVINNVNWSIGSIMNRQQLHDAIGGRCNRYYKVVHTTILCLAK